MQLKVLDLAEFPAFMFAAEPSLAPRIEEAISLAGKAIRRDGAMKTIRRLQYQGIEAVINMAATDLDQALFEKGLNIIGVPRPSTMICPRRTSRSVIRPPLRWPPMPSINS
jgi:hypothetical protein